jgi:hypothetical protein
MRADRWFEYYDRFPPNRWIYGVVAPAVLVIVGTWIAWQGVVRIPTRTRLFPQPRVLQTMELHDLDVYLLALACLFLAGALHCGLFLAGSQRWAGVAPLGTGAALIGLIATLAALAARQFLNFV